MSALARGSRNAFRNPIRTFSITLIVSLSIALAIIMTLSLKSVQTRINDIRSSVGTLITVRPAGSQGFEGGGEPLTGADVTSVKSVAHVASVDATLQDRLSTGTDTNLASSVDPGTLGRKFRNAGGDGPIGGLTQMPTNFSLPVMVTGTTDPANAQTAGGSGAMLKLTSGNFFTGTSNDNVAVVGTDLATKNNLKVGSTFTVHGTTVTVAGIYDAGSKFANSGILMPLATVQRLSGQTDQVSVMNVKADSLDNVNATVTAVQNKLGSSKADVTSGQDASSSVIDSLNNVKSISWYSLIGSLVAGAVIIFLTMVMIVRERRREIGVLKAIGASNFTIMKQFVTESLTFTILGGVVGTIVGALAAGPVVNVLVRNSASGSGGGGMGPGGGGFGFARRALGAAGANLSSLHTAVGLDVILYGLGAAVLIALIGSGLPAYFIAKIRPAEVMRTE